MALVKNPFDCLLVTRPQPEAADLAGRLSIPGLQLVLQPAHEFSQLNINPADLEALQAATGKTPAPLLVFTSTRAVRFALLQLPPNLLARCQLAAIGSATAAALQQAGLQNPVQPINGYRSEDLLQTLDELASDLSVRAGSAWIIAADGGREALLEGLQQRGLDSRKLLVYRRHALAVSPQCRQLLQQSQRVLSVWTSAEAIQQLARELEGPAWDRVCAGDWLVISGRLADIATSYHPAAVHLSEGPGNAELTASIERLCQRT